MRIAIDYDDTFTADPALWAVFIDQAKQRGHHVAFVTFRYASGLNYDILAAAQAMGIDVVFCNYQQKASCYQADIWIDDQPHLIPSNDLLQATLGGLPTWKPAP